MHHLGQKSAELFKRIIQVCYWHLFLPHSSSHEITFENYSEVTNTYFPEYRKLMATYRDLLKEIPYTVRLEAPDYYNDYTSGIAAFIKLISGEGRDASLAPIFKLAKLCGISPQDDKYRWSLLLQLMVAHSNVFSGRVDIYIPTNDSIYSCTDAQYRGITQEDIVVDHDRNEKNLPPFWKWYTTLIHPSMMRLDAPEDVVQEFLATLFASCHLQFCPFDDTVGFMILPFSNIVYMKFMLKRVTPPREGKPDSAVRLYSAIQFVTFGVSNISIIGSDTAIPDGTSQFMDFLKSSVSDEAKSVVRYNISDLDRAQVVGALESYHQARSQAIRQSVIPEGEDDSSLDPDRHDPADDDNLDPDIDRIGQTDVGLEKDDPFALDDDSDDHDDSTDNSSEETPSDGTSDSDGGDSTNDPSDGSVDSGILGDTSTDGTKSNDPSTDGKKDKDKEISSKNATSRKAYKSIWGDNPLVLANDSDVEGYLYRSQVCRLNRRLQLDPGNAIPKNVKNTINEWCKFWVHSTDVRSSISLIKGLGLTKYLKV